MTRRWEVNSINYPAGSDLFLLVWNVYVELLPVCSHGTGAVEFGDEFNQMIAAE